MTLIQPNPSPPQPPPKFQKIGHEANQLVDLLVKESQRLQQAIQHSWNGEVGHVNIPGFSAVRDAAEHLLHDLDQAILQAQKIIDTSAQYMWQLVTGPETLDSFIQAWDEGTGSLVQELNDMLAKCQNNVDMATGHWTGQAEGNFAGYANTLVGYLSDTQRGAVKAGAALKDLGQQLRDLRNNVIFDVAKTALNTVTGVYSTMNTAIQGMNLEAVLEFLAAPETLGVSAVWAIVQEISGVTTEALKALAAVAQDLLGLKNDVNTKLSAMHTDAQELLSALSDAGLPDQSNWAAQPSF